MLPLNNLFIHIKLTNILKINISHLIHKRVLIQNLKIFSSSKTIFSLILKANDRVFKPEVFIDILFWFTLKAFHSQNFSIVFIFSNFML